jgi:glycosyltransferase involved in cell wall biosynthesis
MTHSILILCPDVITERMAGPAIRYWEFAIALATRFEVTLAAVNPISETLKSPQPHIHLTQHTPENIDLLLEQHDIILFQGYILDTYPSLRQSNKVLISDLYDPIPLEGLELHNGLEADWERLHKQVNMLNDQLKWADYFLCASERQRDLWLGHLLSLKRINPATYNEMQDRILTVPFGLPNAPAQRTGQGLRQQLDKEGKFILLWGGGIWEWFDPLTLIRAVHRVSQLYTDVCLVFLGTKHPNPGIDIMPMQHQAQELAKELGVYGKQVIFQPGWVPYETLQNYLLDANVGVTAHFDTLETYFSFRTRILYYLWAGKPIITTKGDVLADAIIEAKAGIVLDFEDEDAWVEAIEKLHHPIYYASYLQGVKLLAKRFLWSEVTAPLLDLCHHATPSPDMYFTPQGRHLIELGNDPYQIELQQLNQNLQQAHRETQRVHEQLLTEHQNLHLEYQRVEHELAEANAYIARIERSKSWRITAPLRALRRFW